MDWLKSLPATKVFRDFYLCHGTLENDCAYFCETVTPKGVALKSIDALVAITSVISQDIIPCGHSHIPRLITLPNGKTIINPGSVGLPAYDDDVPCRLGSSIDTNMLRRLKKLKNQREKTAFRVK